jgi:hypothetical protein
MSSSIQKGNDDSKLDESIKGLTISSHSSDGGLIKRRELFGGAIVIAIPSEWRDVSLVRQVPDHQECYQDCTFHDGSESHLKGTGGCLIIEILGRENDIKDENAAMFFFRDLAEANGPGCSDDDIIFDCVWNNDNVSDSVNSVGMEETHIQQKRSPQILMPKLLPSLQVKVCTCVGYQSISPLKNNKELEDGKADRVLIELCVVRLEAADTDILITLSMPHRDHETDSALEQSPREADKTQDTRRTESGHSNLYKDIIDSFEILDWGLFG